MSNQIQGNHPPGNNPPSGPSNETLPYVLKWIWPSILSWAHENVMPGIVREIHEDILKDLWPGILAQFPEPEGWEAPQDEDTPEPREIPPPELEKPTPRGEVIPLRKKALKVRPWFFPRHFIPRDIHLDPFWQKLSDNGKKYYRFMCEHSWLTEKRPRRRYARHTDKQIAQHIGVSVSQVKRYRWYCLDHFLLWLVTPGNSGTTSKTGKPMAPVFEVPASAGMIEWWRRTRKPWRKRPHKGKGKGVRRTP